MIFNSTVTGASHIRSSKECQDYSMTWQNRSGSIKIAAVSDGHGGEAYFNSAQGSHLACKIAIMILKEIGLSVKHIAYTDRNNILKSACSAIIAHWNESVDHLRGADSVTSFGCTLIAYLQTQEYWLGLQIGDGKFTILNQNGKWRQPIPWDDRCILNFTTSLCDEDAMNKFRYKIGKEIPAAIFLSSDGIDSTFNDGDLMYNFYNQVLLSACNEGYKKIKQELPIVLSHFSEVGSSDDMSLAVIINNKPETNR